jgi:hypothetical protein
VRKLQALVVGLLVVPLLAGGLLAFLQAREALRQEVLGHLTSVANAKQKTVEALVDQWQRDARIQVCRTGLRQRVAQLLQGGAGAEAVRLTVAEDLRQIVTTYGDYRGAAFVDCRDGRPIAWAGVLTPERLSEHMPDALSPVRRKDTEIWVSPVHVHAGSPPHITLSITMLDPAGRQPLAILVLHIDLSARMYPLVDDRTGLGESGEVVVVDQRGLVVKDLRHERGALLKKTIAALPAARARTTPSPTPRKSLPRRSAQAAIRR